MDSYEATKIVFSRIQSLDPENAIKITGYLLLQDHGDKEMIRLAFGPETLLQNLIFQAKTHLGISSNSPSTPSFTSWPLLSPKSTCSLSYASIVNGTSTNNTNTTSSNINTYNNDLVDDYQLPDHFAFLNDSKSETLFDSHLHRRSYSVPGVCFGSEDADSSLGWKPCLYFARGFCKNGSGCRFVHGGDSVVEGATFVGSTSKLSEFEQCQELLRLKAAAQQQKLSAFPYNKCMNLLLQQQNDTHRSASLIMGDELHKFDRCRTDKFDISQMGLGGPLNPSSRQIYLTFPADSTFREEDVSNYFSIYGPVQDVRIPYQQKRMFGFVTFVYPETVKLILAKGNPHFVCDSRVLVKPYKEKGKVPDKYRKQPNQQQQIDRGDYSAYSSPSGLDSREPFDLHFGARMLQNTQEMLLRRKLEEQAELHEAIELQGRRLLNLQFLDFRKHDNNQLVHGLSTGSPIPSPTLPRTPNNHTLIFQPDGLDFEAPEDAAKSPNGNSSAEEKNSTEEHDIHESLERILPDNLFASPKKSASEHTDTVFSTADSEAHDNATTSCSNSNLILPTNMTSLKSCFLQMPRISSGHGTIGM